MMGNDGAQTRSMISKECPSTWRFEAERLAFDLTTGERRFFVITRESTLCCARHDPIDCASAGAVLFVHGAASNASRWEEFVEKTRLKKDRTLLRFDLRMHGASEGLRPATLERHSDDIRAILEAAKIKSCTFVGHSLGSQVLLVFAKHYPDYVNGLVLIDPLIDDALTPKALEFQRQKCWLRLLEIAGKSIDAIGLARHLPKYSLRRADEVARRKLAEGGEALTAFVKSYSSPREDLKFMHIADYARDLLEVSRPTGELAESLRGVPVLVIASKSGAYTDCHKLEAWSNRFGGEFAVLDCVHWPLTECPEEIDELITKWITSRINTSSEVSV